jgi:hypothetical protein
MSLTGWLVMLCSLVGRWLPAGEHGRKPGRRALPEIVSSVGGGGVDCCWDGVPARLGVSTAISSLMALPAARRCLQLVFGRAVRMRLFVGDDWT